MAVSTATTTNDNMLLSYLERRLVRTLEEQVWFYQLCTKYPLPEGSGTSITFNAWRRIAAASSTLSEFNASANNAATLSSRKITATIASYGRRIELTDLFEKTAISSPTQGAIDRLMQSAALSLDNVCQLAIFKNVLSQVGIDGSRSTILSALMSSTASSLCANTGTTGNSRQFGLPAVFGTSAARLSAVSATAPSISARFGPIGLRKAVARLESFDAQPFADGYFAGVTHPKAMATGLGNPDMKQWYLNYAEGPKQSMWKGRVTTPIHGVRLLVSTNTPRYAVTAHSVNLTAILSQDCVGVTELGGGGASMIVKRSGDTTINDPFNLVAAVVSFKLRAVAAVLNPSAGCILFTHEKV